MVECGRRVDQSERSMRASSRCPGTSSTGVPPRSRINAVMPSRSRSAASIPAGGRQESPRQAHEGGVDWVEGCVMGEEPIDQSVKGRVRHWGGRSTQRRSDMCHHTRIDDLLTAGAVHEIALGARSSRISPTQSRTRLQ